MNVLIISASMGAGHDGAAHELQRRLTRDGHRADVRDFLEAFPLGIGRLVRFVYQWELRVAPAAYEATYRLWYRMPIAPLVMLLSTVTSWRVRRWINATDADAVVSTYPLASLTLGHARRRGRLQVPVSTFITDFAVHPLWAARGVDLHMAVHPRAAASAAEQTGATAVATGPLVPERFSTDLPPREEARARLGIPADAKVVLLVAGSWGVGDLRRTFDDIVATGSWVPLVVCGRNERLREALTARGCGWVFGWTDQMPALMAAADVLVENAGGLTCMEAFAAGLPVVTYRPIAGHGKGNAREMAAACVAALAGPGELGDVLASTLTAAGASRRAAGRAMFAGDAARQVVALAARAPVPRELPAARRSRLRPGILVAAVASVVGGVALTSVGAGIAAAHGVAVAHPPPHARAVYLGVRLGPSTIADGRLPAALAADNVTAIVSGQLARDAPASVAELADAGVNLANGGWGAHRGLHWTWAHADVNRAGDAIRDATGGPVRIFAPGPHVDGISLVSAEWADQVVVLTRIVVPSADALPPLRPGGVYVLDARTLSPDELLSVLRHLRGLESDGQSVSPLSALRH